MSTPPRDYDALADRVVEDGILVDPWVYGEPRLSVEPVIVPAALARSLYRAAEQVAEVYNELCLLVFDAPHLLDDFFGMTPYQKAMWFASQPLWHGIARADVFITDEGLAFTELNSDTPTGEAEATVLGRLIAPEHPGLEDPNRDLGERLVSMVASLADRAAAERAAAERASSTSAWSRRTVGLVYPTEFTEDLSLVRLYKKWFEGRGWDVVLGSPYNLTLGSEGTLLLFDTPIDVMLRHYKTDWWSERTSVWDDDEIPDQTPLAAELGLTLNAVVEGRLVVVNPFGAVLPQNKRSMAFMWEHIHRFSPAAQAIIRANIPLTMRLEILHAEQLWAEKDDWVLKSDYGAEGEEVIIGRATADDVWRASLAHARPGRWVAQRYFEAKTTPGGAAINYGVFLVAGEAAGLYTRLERGKTDDRALSAAALLAP